jgi:hypothetical protein
VKEEWGDGARGRGGFQKGEKDDEKDDVETMGGERGDKPMGGSLLDILADFFRDVIVQ